MQRVREYADDRQKTLCIHCARPLSELAITRDHVPSKCFLLEPFPTNLPVIHVCSDCNNGFSFDEEYTIAFLETVLADSVDDTFEHNPRIARAFSYNSKLRSEIQGARTEALDHKNEIQIMWSPNLKRIQNVILKNARGHALHEFSKPMLDFPSIVDIVPLICLTDEQRSQFESQASGNDLWPEVGSRMMNRMLEANSDLKNGWITVQDGIYRYSVSQVQNGLVVKSVIREYLATQVVWQETNFY